MSLQEIKQQIAQLSESEQLEVLNAIAGSLPQELVRSRPVSSSSSGQAASGQTATGQDSLPPEALGKDEYSWDE